MEAGRMLFDAQQWERLGNAVPPVMMKAIAVAVRDGVLRRCEKAG